MRYIKPFCFFIYSFILINTVSSQSWNTPSTPAAEPEIDTLMINEDAIYIKILPGQMMPSKKKYASSLLCMVDAAPDPLTEYWKSKFKNEYNIKLRNRRDLMVAENVNLLELSTRTITVYSLTEQIGNQTKIEVCMEINEGEYVDSIYYPEEYNRLKTFLHKSVKQYYINYYNTVLVNLQSQHDALLKQKQQLLSEKSKIDQEQIRNKNVLASAKKTKVHNEAEISKADSKIRLNEEIIIVNKEKTVLLETELSQLRSSGNDETPEESDKRLSRLKAVEKDLSKAANELKKSSKNTVNAEKTKGKAEIRLRQAEETIRQREQMISHNQEAIQQKDSQLEATEKKLTIKQDQIRRVNTKKTKIY